MKATLFSKFHFSLSQTDNTKPTLFCKFPFSSSQTDNTKHSVNFISVCLKPITRNTLFCKFHFSLSQTDNMKATLYCKFHFSLSDNMKATLFCKFHLSLYQTDNMKATIFYKFPCALWSKLSQALDINHLFLQGLNLLLTACFSMALPWFLSRHCIYFSCSMFHENFIGLISSIFAGKSMMVRPEGLWMSKQKSRSTLARYRNADRAEREW